MKLLLLEDDQQTAEALEKGLEREGHAVSRAHNVEEARALLVRQTFEIAILDVMVPGGSGYDVLSQLKATSPSTVTLMLTARGAVEDRVAGLDRGADDYLLKPFSFSELTARIRAVRRRRSGPAALLRAGELEIDVVRRVATVGGRRIDLTPTEFSLLASLLRAAGEALSRTELLREVWGYDFDPGTNVVDVHVNRVRRKLDDAGISDLVRTVRGRGYAAG